jgi:hypothetical protein
MKVTVPAPNKETPCTQFFLINLPKAGKAKEPRLTLKTFLPHGSRTGMFYRLTQIRRNTS